LEVKGKMKAKKEDGDRLYSQARKIYKRLKSRFEPQHRGEIVAIEAESGRYIIGKDELDTALKAKKKFPGKVFNFFRVGYPVVHKFRKI